MLMNPDKATSLLDNYVYIKPFSFIDTNSMQQNNQIFTTIERQSKVFIIK